MSIWISCYDRLPDHQQAVIFRTDHEGVECGRFFKSDDTTTSVAGTFRAITESGGVIGWHCRPTNRAGSEVHEWMPLPD